jgi:hypothetical protein
LLPGLPGSCLFVPGADGVGLVEDPAGVVSVLTEVVSCVVPEVDVWWELFTWVTIGGVFCWASPLDATAKLASAAHAVATPTPAAASSA